MKNVSDAVKNAVKSGYLFYLEIRIDYADGTHEYLSKQNFNISNNSFTDGTGISSFPIGNAHAKQVNISIINTGDKYRNVDFANAIITVNACVDIDGEKHEIPLGQHTVIDPESYGDIIEITAMDEMYKGDTEYVPGIEFPNTIGQMFVDSCQQCGVIAVSDEFPNDDYIINDAPVGMTHRSLWGWCGMIAGGNARMNAENKLEIVQYSWNYSDPAEIDGCLSCKVASDDVVITGIKTTVDGNVYSTGTIGYVIDISSEISVPDPQALVDRIGQTLIGARFRPFDATVPSSPLLEFADPIVLVDSKGNRYKSIVTDLDYSFYGKTSVKCSANNAIRNSSSYNSEAANAYNKASESIKREETERKEDVKKALTIIGSKNKAFYQSEEPTSEGRVLNDLWFDSGHGYHMYFWNGVQWESSKFGTDAFAAGSITAALIAAGTITADKINLNDLFAQNITATGQITGATLIGSNISGTKGSIGGFDLYDNKFMSASEYRNDESYRVNTEFSMSNGGGTEAPYLEYIGAAFLANLLTTKARLQIGGGGAKASGVTAFDWIKLAMEFPYDNAESYLKLERYAAILKSRQIMLSTDTEEWKPYYEAGDTIAISDIYTSGVVSNSAKKVSFFVPLSKPIIGSPTITLATGSSLIITQGGKYTHGSAASTSATPSSWSFKILPGGISVISNHANTENSVTHDSCAILFSGVFVLS